MAVQREHPEDELVHAKRTERGVHFQWRRHDTGDHYGGDAYDDEARAVLLQEGLSPEEFFPAPPHLFT